MGGGITRTFRPWTHTSDDSYIYQLSLVVATATILLLFWVNPSRFIRFNHPMQSFDYPTVQSTSESLNGDDCFAYVFICLHRFSRAILAPSPAGGAIGDLGSFGSANFSLSISLGMRACEPICDKLV